MTQDDDYDCQDVPTVQGRCDVCIDQLIVIGTEILGALTTPIEQAIFGFVDAATTLQRRLKWGARKQLEAIEATAVAMGPMPATGLPLGAVQAEGHISTTVRKRDTPSVDLDQPHVLLFDERGEPWHAQMTAYYGAPMAAFLNATTLAQWLSASDAIREMQAKEPIPSAPNPKGY